MAPYLTDILEVLDVHPLGVHDLLDDIGPHLLLALSVFVAGRASILLLLLALRAAGILRQLFLIDTQLQCTHREGGRGGLGEVAPEQAGAPHGFCFLGKAA